MPSRRRALALEVYAFHEKGFLYECLVSTEKCGDGKRYRCFVGCSICNMYIYGSMRDIEVKDSKNMGL